MKHDIFLYAAALLPSAASCTVPDAERPNIILIYADDLGIGDIGCYGQQYIRTPSLDRMAAEGIVFTNHYSGSAVSAPSRSCLMTGQHSGHTVIRANAAYAGMISRLDRRTGGIMDLLDSLGMSENTLLMFGSDNGPCSVGGVDTDFFISTAGLSGAKRSLKEGGIRAPLIAKWTGKTAPGSKTDLLSAQYDYMATFADLAGCDVPEGTDGISFAPTLTGRPQKEKHEFLYWEYIEQGGQQAIRTGNLKAYRKGLLEDSSSPWELYDLEKDPGEKHDLSRSMPETVARIDSIAAGQHSPAVLPEWEIFGNKR